MTFASLTSDDWLLIVPLWIWAATQIGIVLLLLRMRWRSRSEPLKIAVSEQPQSAADMAAAEIRVREATAGGSPTERLNALMRVYWSTPDDKRDALFAVLAARLTLVRPAPAEPEAA